MPLSRILGISGYSSPIEKRKRKNRQEFFRFCKSKFNIKDEDFEDEKKFQTIMRDLKLNDIINE